MKATCDTGKVDYVFHIFAPSEKYTSFGKSGTTSNELPKDNLLPLPAAHTYYHYFCDGKTKRISDFAIP